MTDDREVIKSLTDEQLQDLLPRPNVSQEEERARIEAEFEAHRKAYESKAVKEFDFGNREPLMED